MPWSGHSRATVNSVKTIDSPFLVPPGTYPPTTVRWTASFSTIPPGAVVWRVPFQPGTPSGLLVPIAWTITDIWFRVETPSAAAQSTLQIQRSTGDGAFASVNLINTTPTIIPANAYEPTLQPPPISNPQVNSGDKLQPVFVLGAGAYFVSMAVTFVQTPIGG